LRKTELGDELKWSKKNYNREQHMVCKVRCYGWAENSLVGYTLCEHAD